MAAVEFFSNIRNFGLFPIAVWNSSNQLFYFNGLPLNFESLKSGTFETTMKRVVARVLVSTTEAVIDWSHDS